MRRQISTLLPILLALVLAACGDSEPEGASPGPTEAVVDGAADPEPDEPSANPEPEAGNGAEEGWAVVTIGDLTIEFEMTINCFEMGGFLSFAGNAADGSDWQFHGGLGGDPGDDDLVLRRIEGDERWEVDPDLYPESGFTDVTHEGERAQGEVVFADILGNTQAGTFEVVCP